MNNMLFSSMARTRSIISRITVPKRWEGVIVILLLVLSMILSPGKTAGAAFQQAAGPGADRPLNDGGSDAALPLTNPGAFISLSPDLHPTIQPDLQSDLQPDLQPVVDKSGNPIILQPEGLKQIFFRCREDDSGVLDLKGVSAKVGDEILIAVLFQSIPSQIFTFGFEVTYDASIMEYTGFSKGSLSAFLSTFDVYTTDRDRLRGGGYSFGRGIAKGTSGCLVWLKFKIKGGSDGECYPVQVEELVDDIDRFTASGACVCITSATARMWYRDGDQDGYGTRDVSQTQSEQPAGYVSNADDCDDSQARINPKTIWYFDEDKDGYGDKDRFVVQCEQPRGNYVLEAPDNCPKVYNPQQTNSDKDPFGDACDNCPLVENKDQTDKDRDGRGDTCDLCPDYYNPDQEAGPSLQPDEISLGLVEFTCGQKIEFRLPTATDDCTGHKITATPDIAARDIPSNIPGTYTISWTYRYGKGSGIALTQKQTVVVVDRDEPVPMQPSLPPITGECVMIAYDPVTGPEWACKTGTVTPPRAVDPCAGEITGFTKDSLNFQKPGDHKITWIYNDGHGNENNQPQLFVLTAVARVGQDQAFKNLKDAIDAMGKVKTDAEIEVGEIRVAKGQYRFEQKVTIRNGMKLIGGWESGFTQRDEKTGRSILSGASIVFMDAENSGMDGFIVEYAHAGFEEDVPPLAPSNRVRFREVISYNIAYSGGGIYCQNSSPTIANSEIRSNWAYEAGGGLFCVNSSPVITDCIIAGNRSDLYGGGICCINSSLVIQNCTISENWAKYGGGVCCDGTSTVTVTNCTLWCNNASYEGSGIFTKDSSLKIVNCTLWGNGSTASRWGGGIFSENAQLTVTNSILWQDAPDETRLDSRSNCTITYSVIQGGFGDPSVTHNLQEDPLFKDTSRRNFYLSSSPAKRSPCIDAGTNVDAPAVDRDGRARPYDGDCDGQPMPDLGAYEYYDDQKPVPCQNPLPAARGQCQVVLTPPTATDDCAGTVSATTKDPTLYTGQGSFLVTWIYDDGHGNTTSQEQLVTVQDTTPPEPDYNPLPDLGTECGDQVHLTSPTATDLCTGWITGTTDDPLPTPSSPPGTYTLTWNYRDIYGNTSYQMQKIVVTDTKKPVPDLDVLPDIVAENSFTLTPPTATDRCQGKIMGAASPLTYTEKGNHTVIWTFHDGSGNTAYQEQKVTIKRVFFVNPDHPGGLEYHYANIEDAIDHAGKGDTIRLATGSYFDTQVTIRDGIRLEGGWNSDFSKRDPALYPVILIGRPAQPVIAFTDANQAEIDGLTITHDLNSLLLKRLRTSGTMSGCMAGTLSDTARTNVTLPERRLAVGGSGSGSPGSGGTGGSGGSGIYCFNSSPAILNCTVSGNSAPYGAGIYCERSSASITRCIIAENSADFAGGGIYWTSDSEPVILNCRLYHNTAGQGTPSHVSMAEATYLCTDLELAGRNTFQHVHFLIYDSLTELAGSVYQLFEQPCGLDRTIGDDDLIVISLQP
ncbi:MAG: right-handed parallel beta-helix repeat-containing protein [bacterium]